MGQESAQEVAILEEVVVTATEAGDQPAGYGDVYYLLNR